MLQKFREIINMFSNFCCPLMKLYLLVCRSGLKTGDLGRSLPSGDGLLGGVEVGSGIVDDL